MVRRAIATTAAASALGLALAGCGSGSPDTPPPPTVDPAAVAWAGQICGAIQQQAINPEELPAPTRANPTPSKLKETMLAYLATLAENFAAVLGEVRQAGPPPVRGGERMVSATIERLKASERAFTQARDRVAQIPTTDAARFTSEMQEVYQDLKHVAGARQALSNLKTNAELSAAFEQAKRCQ